ncbi:Aste57867_1426 [Aphanomyces stellatus]|uniref:Aste57867_1426 protein n=1 Tax=Aphanomyces stellatus TaxID=120398 RepID=A0A485K9D2_9STRA|nr:hypothetical protein As57867_001425 [Aphanomyces stellatus]VFT78643.1 Aste57867_1426 [Aphanomyces stellatus]
MCTCVACSLFNLPPQQHHIMTHNYRTLLEHISLQLFQEQHRRVSELALRSAAVSELRLFVRESLTTRKAGRPNETLFQLVDELLLLETRKRTLVSAADIPALHSDTQHPLARVALFHGDITSLAVDVIANAANTAMLGCFQPTHKCIDNIIHDVAGPRLRHACAQVKPDAAGDRLPTGHAFLTPGFALPAKFVAHTVGPQLRQGSTPSPAHETQLQACYTNTLDEALRTVPRATTAAVSIAFPCISTGLFGYPSKLATPLAIEAVTSWLAKHPELTQWKVIFNTFIPSDLQLYQATLERLYGSVVSSPATAPSPLTKAAALIRDADFLLITAGAGLSAAAGLDYTSSDVFAKHHAPMVRRGFRNMYQFIGFHDWSPALAWGYYFAQTNLARFHWTPTTPVYSLLKQLFNAKASFVQTTNADGMFEQQGFPTQRIYTVQGDYGRIQCLRPCRDSSIWDIKPFLEKGLACLDPNTYELTDPAAIPRCPHCGGDMMLNVRGGNWFIESVHAPQRRAYHQWLETALHQVRTAGKKLVVLEIGAGFNTPGVLRFPNEELAELDGVDLVRLNTQHEDLPPTSNGVGVSNDANEALRTIVEAVLAHST